MEFIDFLTWIGSVIGSVIVIVGSGVAWILNCIRKMETTIHARSNKNKDRIHELELKLAEEYVSKQSMAEMEERIIKHIDEKIDHIAQLMEVKPAK